ncbi:MAG: YfiR/HmsC family protein [Bacteroidota bacterium]
MSGKKLFIFLVLILAPFALLKAQNGLTDQTRALYILDISKYVKFDSSFNQQEEFSIAILDNDDKFYWEVANLAKTRKFIQGKPIRVYLYPTVSRLERTNVVFANSAEGIKIDELLTKVHGWNTLLISEGYPFRQSMINFIVVDGKPRFEANEELMRAEGLIVDELFLAQAVKTREDWEVLFQETDVKLSEEKEVTRQQKILIDDQLKQIREQDSMIIAQKGVLDQLFAEIKKKQAALEQKALELSRMLSEIAAQKKVIGEQVAEVNRQKEVLAGQQADIDAKQETIRLNEEVIKKNDETIAIQVEAIQKQRLIIYAAILALILVSGLVYFIYKNYRDKKKANLLLEEKNRVIALQKEEAEQQRDQIAYQKKHITDSIEYAKRIQRALLPSLELFSDKFEHFVLYKPRDIVSGDFYWVNRLEDKQVIITADCTGHGVPGAFMSMLGVSMLNEIINNRKVLSPEKVLNSLRDLIVEALKQQQAENSSGVKDGMDMTVCIIDYKRNKLTYAGANNPLYLIRNGELTEYKADKMPVAVHEIMNDFSLNEIDLQKGDTFYTFSDGYCDQFGGPQQKKFLSKNFRKVLLEIQDLTMYEQGVKLNEIFEDYKKDVEQVDDVLVIGVKY